MQIRYTKTFKKQFQKLTPKIQTRFQQRLKLFHLNPTHPTLRVHPLSGAYQGYWSMSVTGDLRALYRKQDEELIIFALIGTHSQLYG